MATAPARVPAQLPARRPTKQVSVSAGPSAVGLDHAARLSLQTTSETVVAQPGTPAGRR